MCSSLYEGREAQLDGREAAVLQGEPRRPVRLPAGLVRLPAPPLPRAGLAPLVCTATIRYKRPRRNTSQKHIDTYWITYFVCLYRVTWVGLSQICRVPGLIACYSSCLLPQQDGGTSQIIVNPTQVSDHQSPCNQNFHTVTKIRSQVK